MRTKCASTTFKKGDRVRIKAALQLRLNRLHANRLFFGKVGEVIKVEVSPLKKSQDLVWVRFKIKGIGRASFLSDDLEAA